MTGIITSALSAAELAIGDEANVAIGEKQTATPDYANHPLTQITVSGRILGSNYPYSGLAEATITLSGYETYSAGIDEEGYFSIPGVYTNHTYQYRVHSDGYYDWAGQLVVGSSNVYMGTIILLWIAPPPSHVVAREPAGHNYVEITWNAPAGDSSMVAYKVWRLIAADQNNEANWTMLTPNVITAFTFTDHNWLAQPEGIYKYAVKAYHLNNNVSEPVFSNPITKPSLGTLAGIVRNLQDAPIVGVNIYCADTCVSTNAYGTYSMYVPSGTYTVYAYKPDYGEDSETGVVISPGQTTTLNFRLGRLHPAFNDSFEGYADFATTFAPWTCVDVDMGETYPMPGTSWPGSGSAFGYMVFNPSATIPPITDFTAHSGSKMAVAMASQNPPNNDWLISPPLLYSFMFGFWARSCTADYGLERFRVGVSTTGTTPEDFTIISGANSIQAPTTWTSYNYNLSGYSGLIHIGIQCVSFDAGMFMVDDVYSDGETAWGEQQTIPLATGWNLVSLHLSPADHSIASLITGISNDLQQIKGLEGVYIPGDTNSTLDSLANGKAYGILMDSPATWCVWGSSIPENTPLELTDGWNMVSFLPRNYMSTPAAMSSIAPWIVQVKAPDGVYIPDNPYSTLPTMSPGKGYWIKVNGAHTLYYPANREDASVLSGSRLVAPLSTSMTVLARCDGAVPGDLLVATVEGVERGEEMMISPEGFTAALIQIYTETAGEDISFHLVKQDGRIVNINTHMQSEPNAILGDYPDFIPLELLPNGCDEEIQQPTELLGSYPNPFTNETNIRYQVGKDNAPVKVEVYNIKGQMLCCLTDQAHAKGVYSQSWDGTDRNGSRVASGMYFIKMSSGQYHKTLKLLHMK